MIHAIKHWLGWHHGEIVSKLDNLEKHDYGMPKRVNVYRINPRSNDYKKGC